VSTEQRKFPENLIDNGSEKWNKWRTESSKTAWVEITIPEEVEFSVVGFKSANNKPHNDPESVDFSYWDDNGWVEVDTYNLDFEKERWHTL